MIFLDSSVIIAYKNADDTNHTKAAEIFNKLTERKYGKGVISEFIFTEVTTVLALKRDLNTATNVGNILLAAKEIEIMKTSDVFKRTWDIFKNQKNTKLSFVGASNLACMEQRKIKRIATFDKDFLKIKSIEVVRNP